MRAGDERKLVTVLFADLVGSTAYADERDPERVRAALERFYAAMQDEIERTGGTVEKFAGDAVMAVFGAPAAFEDHVERALHAALAMQRRVRELFGDELEMRVGVNTGEVVVGASRAGGSFVTGDAVNVADRLQKAAETGEVLAGERTAAAAVGAFELGPPRAIEAKGKPGGVVGVPILRALGLVRPRGVGGLRRVFVGRDGELELLLATYRRAAANAEPHLVTIVGEPGVGKSRLVRELEDALGEEEVVPTVRTGRCLPYGDGITYWPLGEIVREHYGLREGASADEVTRALDGHAILGLALGLDVAAEVHPRDARERLHAAAVSFVEQLAAERPAVVLVEDIHWAESDLLDLVDRLATDVHAPVLLLATTRPDLLERRSSVGSGSRNTAVLWLDPLPAPAATRMLEEMLPAVLPEELRDLVVERADGNPFFLEELVGELADSGVLVQSEDTWVVGEPNASFSMPDSVHVVLAARIDRLPAGEKAALQAAAVVGRVFWTASVVHLLQGAEPDFALLEERDLIRSRRGSTIEGDREYAFKHALTREVAYGSIPRARRGRLHAALADWLAQSSLGRDELAPLVAYHYSQAAEPEDADLVWADEADGLERVREKAVEWLRRAGELTRRRHEIADAIELLERAVSLSRDEHERALLWREIGLAQALRFDGEAFWAAMERSLDGPLDTNERADAYSLLAFQTSIRSGMWSVRPSRGKIEEWVERALELSREGSVEQIRALIARIQADPSDASEELLDATVTGAEETGDTDLLSFALGARSHAAFVRLQFEEAQAWSRRRLELVDRIDDPDSLCEMYESGVPAAASVGLMQEARNLCDAHWPIANRLSAHHRVHAVSLRLELADTLGDWSGVVEDTDLVTALVRDNLATPCVRNTRDLLVCALAHRYFGDETRSRALQREAENLGGEGHERDLAHPRLRLALARGELDVVREFVRLQPQRTFVWGGAIFGGILDALVALRDWERIERDAPPLLQPGTVPEPFALRALGIARADDVLLAKADERFAALGLAWYRAQTEAMLAAR